jgi:hypothetical protein
MGIYLFKKAVFNCKTATLLALKKNDGAASMWEELQLFYHNLYCNSCRRFIKQSAEIDILLADITRRERENPTHNLPDHVKNYLQAQIDQFRK